MRRGPSLTFGPTGPARRGFSASDIIRNGDQAMVWLDSLVHPRTMEDRDGRRLSVQQDHSGAFSCRAHRLSGSSPFVCRVGGQGLHVCRVPGADALGARWPCWGSMAGEVGLRVVKTGHTPTQSRCLAVGAGYSKQPSPPTISRTVVPSAWHTHAALAPLASRP